MSDEEQHNQDPEPKVEDANATINIKVRDSYWMTCARMFRLLVSDNNALVLGCELGGRRGLLQNQEKH